MMMTRLLVQLKQGRRQERDLQSWQLRKVQSPRTKRTGSEARVTVPGHTQRGGSPVPYDRALCTRLGAAAAKAILDKDYGKMIAMVDDKTKRVPLEKVAGKLKAVDPQSQMIEEAKFIGISFGD